MEPRSLFAKKTVLKVLLVSFLIAFFNLLFFPLDEPLSFNTLYVLIFLGFYIFVFLFMPSYILLFIIYHLYYYLIAKNSSENTRSSENYPLFSKEVVLKLLIISFILSLFICFIFIFYRGAKCLPNASCIDINPIISTVVLNIVWIATFVVLCVLYLLISLLYRLYRRFNSKR
jgi:hypothetical protein